MNSIKRRWIPQKPPCVGGLGFTSIGITEVKPALMMFAFGSAFAFFVMFAELIHKFPVRSWSVWTFCSAKKVAVD